MVIGCRHADYEYRMGDLPNGWHCHLLVNRKCGAMILGDCSRVNHRPSVAGYRRAYRQMNGGAVEDEHLIGSLAHLDYDGCDLDVRQHGCRLPIYGGFGHDWLMHWSCGAARVRYYWLRRLLDDSADDEGAHRRGCRRWRFGGVVCLDKTKRPTHVAADGHQSVALARPSDSVVGVDVRPALLRR